MERPTSHHLRHGELQETREHSLLIMLTRSSDHTVVQQDSVTPESAPEVAQRSSVGSFDGKPFTNTVTSYLGCVQRAFLERCYHRVRRLLRKPVAVDSWSIAIQCAGK